jgi:hypothetical protein
LWIVDDFLLVQDQRLYGVLVGVRVNRFFEGLAQQVLAVFLRHDVEIGAQQDVVGGQRIGRYQQPKLRLTWRRSSSVNALR